MSSTIGWVPAAGLELVHMRVMDVALHTKDLCDGLDAVWQPTPELCEFVLDTVSPIISEFRAAGLFGPACEPASDSAVDRLLAFTAAPANAPIHEFTRVRNRSCC